MPTNSIVQFDNVDGRNVINLVFAKIPTGSDSYQILLADTDDGNDGPIDLGGKEMLLLNSEPLDISTCPYRNGVLLSNQTILVGYDNSNDVTSLKTILSGWGLKLLGKFRNIDGLELSARGDVINRSMKLLYNYSVRYSINNQYSSGLNLMSQRANDVSLNECLILLNARHDLDSDGSVSGTRAECNVYNTPEDLAREIFMNGLTVKGIKFHHGQWHKSFAEYKTFLLSYVTGLKNAIQNLNEELLFKTGYQIPMFSEVYIINENGLWTSAYSTVLNDVVALASAVRTLGFDARESFAGIKQLASASPLLRDYIKPGLNTYPTLSYKDDAFPYESDTRFTADDVLAIMNESFPRYATVWNGQYAMSELAISETGIRPGKEALRYPELSSEMGTRWTPAVSVYWNAFLEMARERSFEYVDVFYTEDLYYQNDDVLNLPDVMYDLFMNC